MGAVAAEHAPFTARLRGVRHFPHRHDATVWLDPAGGGPARGRRSTARWWSVSPAAGVGRTTSHPTCPGADPGPARARAPTARPPGHHLGGTELTLLSRRGDGPMRTRFTVEPGTGEVRQVPQLQDLGPA
ncbi:hypothetical protein [Kitasatospora sp. NPDC050463]|uniref:hypothetical protein n=1 Tax=Kitasatospora sp. NPDC050463 TaxID=3155786 RepID=UPI0033D8DB4F